MLGHVAALSDPTGPSWTSSPHLLFARSHPTLNEPPPEPRSRRDNYPTLLVSWWCTGCAIVLIGIRIWGRMVRTSRLFREDWIMLASVIPLLGRMAFINPVMLFGTNNVAATGLSAEDIHDREIGSRLVLGGRIFYAMFIWIAKFTISEYFKRLTQNIWTKRYETVLHGIRIFLVLTFVCVVAATLGECQPFTRYWQVTPDPGAHCRTGFAQVIVMGSCDIVTDLLLIGFPIPIVLRSAMQPKRKISLCLLFAMSIILIAITAYRIPAIIHSRGSQQLRTLWASLEVLAAAAVSNALIIGSFIRDRGAKKLKYRANGSGDGDDDKNSVNVAERVPKSTRSRHSAAVRNADEGLYRAIGGNLAGAMDDDVEMLESPRLPKPAHKMPRVRVRESQQQEIDELDLEFLGGGENQAQLGRSLSRNEPFIAYRPRHDQGVGGPHGGKESQLEQVPETLPSSPDLPLSALSNGDDPTNISGTTLARTPTTATNDFAFADVGGLLSQGPSTPRAQSPSRIRSKTPSPIGICSSSRSPQSAGPQPSLATFHTPNRSPRTYESSGGANHGDSGSRSSSVSSNREIPGVAVSSDYASPAPASAAQISASHSSSSTPTRPILHSSHSTPKKSPPTVDFFDEGGLLGRPIRYVAPPKPPKPTVTFENNTSTINPPQETDTPSAKLGTLLTTPKSKFTTQPSTTQTAQATSTDATGNAPRGRSRTRNPHSRSNSGNIPRTPSANARDARIASTEDEYRRNAKTLLAKIRAARHLPHASLSGSGSDSETAKAAAVGKAAAASENAGGSNAHKHKRSGSRNHNPHHRAPPDWKAINHPDVSLPKPSSSSSNKSLSSGAAAAADKSNNRPEDAQPQHQPEHHEKQPKKKDNKDMVFKFHPEIQTPPKQQQQHQQPQQQSHKPSTTDQTHPQPSMLKPQEPAPPAPLSPRTLRQRETEWQKQLLRATGEARSPPRSPDSGRLSGRNLGTGAGAGAGAGSGAGEDLEAKEERRRAREERMRVEKEGNFRFEDVGGLLGGGSD
ncbi:MAG: hypothetical protein M1831_001876 [Alyxoria varia]|nr:MAG: hypothetical protein M1831_001876 [Alyxoria varia]